MSASAAFATRTFTRDGLGFVELRHAPSQSIVEVCPERGALVTRYAFAGREVLFLDDKTLVDRNASVRGGIPILFPNPGRLPPEGWSWNGVGGQLPQHGFARRLPWHNEALTAGAGDAQLTLSLAATAETLAGYPFRFALRMRIQLTAEELAIAVDVVNQDARAMPFAWGWHPYFALPRGERAATSIDTHARAFFDRLADRERPIAELDLTAPELDVLLIGHDTTSLPLHCPSNPLEVRCSLALRNWVLWLQPERDFFCVEPWTSPANALNSGRDLLVLEPGARSLLSMAIVPARLPR
jgi:galactose mutarotase-like enzyme